MMCACDEEFGRRFLSHQLSHGTELLTRKSMRVTDGFQPNICAECRGLPAEPAPVAEGFGRTSKIKRYYWRELFFEETRRKADWDDANKGKTREERQLAHHKIEQAVLDDIKKLHATDPKYIFNDLSQAQIFERYGVEVIDIRVEYAVGAQKGALIRAGNRVLSPEEYVTKIYQDDGWSVMRLESIPFHVLFGTMLWLLIQDPDDPQTQWVGFGERAAFKATGQKTLQVWMSHPSDFGTQGYYSRRKQAIERHFELLPPEREQLLWLFDYWIDGSNLLRNYLWAHRPDDIDRSRRLIEILQPFQIVSILHYLLGDYWGRYLGWPDLILHRDNEVLLLEVKSSGDKLSQDQKDWIAGNWSDLQLPFKVVKLHRASTR